MNGIPISCASRITSTAGYCSPTGLRQPAVEISMARSRSLMNRNVSPTKFRDGCLRDRKPWILMRSRCDRQSTTAARRHRADPREIVGVDRVDVASDRTGLPGPCCRTSVRRPGNAPSRGRNRAAPSLPPPTGGPPRRSRDRCPIQSPRGSRTSGLFSRRREMASKSTPS